MDAGRVGCKDKEERRGNRIGRKNETGENE